MILLISFPAAMGEGTGCGSSTRTFVYPRRARCRAAEQPQVPAPTIKMEDECVIAIANDEGASSVKSRRRLIVCEALGVSTAYQPSIAWTFPPPTKPGVDGPSPPHCRPASLCLSHLTSILRQSCLGKSSHCRLELPRLCDRLFISSKGRGRESRLVPPRPRRSSRCHGRSYLGD